MELSESVYLLVPFVAWAISQSSKYLLQGLKSNSLKDFTLLYKSGSMPSSHSALMVALLTTIGIKNGIQSVEFAIVGVLAVIVLYDAVNVRRAVGEQGVALAQLQQAKKQKTEFYTAKGHTLLEVCGGSLVGFLIAVLMLQFL